jgi:predicted AlkP superfamily phosphohydrolase/phosphomutase
MTSSIATESPAKTPRAYPQPQRPLKPIVNRLLIIGLDGATFDVLNPMMDAGRMPHLKQFIADGAAGILNSTKPPITPAAWTTFMTGKGPGRHGILDFEKFDIAKHELSFNSTYQIREKTLWELLSEKGLRVGSINVPMTYPPKPVNGFMISGFETPSIDANFTWPAELKEEILREIPTYNYRTNWQRRALGGEDVLARNLEYICNSFDQGLQLTRFCGQKYGWDVLMVLYKLVDNLQHKTWKYLDPRTADAYPHAAEMVADCFTRLDNVLGGLFEYAAENDANVLIMSDHGHGSLEGKAQPNLLLKEWGYLTLRNAWDQAGTRVKHWVHRMTKGKVTRFEQGTYAIERELAVDWSRTKACVVHAGIYGFLYMNVRDRGPYGIVDPAEYESLRDEIAEKLQSATALNKDGQSIRIFPEIYKTEQLYNCSREEAPNLPDLLLVPHHGLAVVRKIRRNKPVRWIPDHRMEGTHRVEGIMAMGGPGVRQGASVSANIVDITPTVLASLGLRVPLDMEGQVIKDAFEVAPVVESEPPVERAKEGEADVYTDEERRLIEARLSDLGYLE